MSKEEITPGNKDSPIEWKWKVTPHSSIPNSFDLKDNTGRKLCVITFPEGANTGRVKLIAAAPELRVITKLCLRLLEGDKTMKDTRIIEMIKELISRVK